MRNEPQAEPFVGQARCIYRKYLFEVKAAWSGRNGDGLFGLVLICSLTEIYLIHVSTGIKTACISLIFGHRYPLAGETDSF